MLREPKGHCKMKMELDRISNLPDNIIDHILSHLSIKDAAKTSLLSSQWRYKWAMFPYLVFNNSSFPHLSLNQAVTSRGFGRAVILNKFVSIIDQVLLLHFGPIHKFELSYTLLPLAQSVIDRWIHHLSLSRTSIKEFVLNSWIGRVYRVPSSLFLCQSLTNLVLCRCFLKPPPSFEGFKSLKSLKLQSVRLAQDVFENLISGCPVLERLNLAELNGVDHLNINAPNLQVFNVAGTFDSISFENTSRLAEVTISNWFCLYIPDGQNLAYGKSSNLLKFLVQLPHIQRLDVQCDFFKYLAVGIEPYKLPNLYVDLVYLAIDISLNCREDSLTARCLLGCAPNLQELQLVVSVDETTIETENNFWEDDHSNCLLTKLQRMKIFGIGDSQSELDFVRFMLSKSPALERMVVNPGGGLSPKVELELVKKFLCFKRASNRAEIIWSYS